MIKIAGILFFGIIIILLFDSVLDILFVKETPAERRDRYYREYLMVNGVSDSEESRKDFEEIMKR